MLQKFNTTEFLKHRNFTDISEAMADNADLLGYYGEQEALWNSKLDELKLLLDTKSAQVELDLKASGDKITEATAKAHVTTHKDVIALRTLINEAKEQQRLYSNGFSTIDNRGLMLRSIGARQRTELDQTNMHTPYRTQNMSDSVTSRLTEDDRERIKAILAG